VWLVAALLSGCDKGAPAGDGRLDHVAAELEGVKENIKALRESIGPWAYLDLDPQLEVTLAKSEFRDPKEKSDWPMYQFTIQVRQHNDAFQLAKYTAIVQIGIYRGRSRVAATNAAASMENGVGASAEIGRFLPNDQNSGTQGLWARVEGYRWLPYEDGIPLHPSYAPEHGIITDDRPVDVSPEQPTEKSDWTAALKQH